MKTVNLAGAIGTRISEETVVKPKPMIEIGDKFGVTRIGQALSGGMSVANGVDRQLFYLATRLRSHGEHARD